MNGGEIVDESLRPENSTFKRKKREHEHQLNQKIEQQIRKDQGYPPNHPYMQKRDS